MMQTSSAKVFFIKKHQTNNPSTSTFCCKLFVCTISSKHKLKKNLILFKLPNKTLLLANSQKQFNSHSSFFCKTSQAKKKTIKLMTSKVLEISHSLHKEGKEKTPNNCGGKLKELCKMGKGAIVVTYEIRVFFEGAQKKIFSNI